jgi:Ca-activated chloride channel family protein
MNALRELLALDGFAWRWMLLAIPLPLLVHALVPARSASEAALRVPWGERLRRIANAGAVSAKPRGFPWLLFLAWCLLCIAAARPQQLGPAIAPPQVGRDLMLAVDLSASMGEEDMELGGRIVDRLTAAKAVLADFLDRRAGDRVGLVVFG